MCRELSDPLTYSPTFRVQCANSIVLFLILTVLAASSQGRGLVRVATLVYMTYVMNFKENKEIKFLHSVSILVLMLEGTLQGRIDRRGDFELLSAPIFFGPDSELNACERRYVA